MEKSSQIARRAGCRTAFTLVEVLVSMTVLVLLVTVIAQMTGGVSSIVGRGEARIDTDAQARALLGRMAIDIGAMVKRPDVDYYLKGRPSTLNQPGNDQIAFYSEVPGYFSTSTGTTEQSATSLVAYRVNSTTMRMERLCKGLAWNGSSTTSDYTMGFLPIPLASPLPSPLPSPMPTSSPLPLWPQAASPNTPDLDYEQLGPQVFRFEYFYVLKGQGALGAPSVLSLTPWYVNAPVNHLSVNGMQDVAGIGVLIAVIDQKARNLVSANQLTTLVNSMSDPVLDPSTGALTIGGSPVNGPADIEQQWQTVVNNNTILPRRASAAIHLYTRCFYLNGVSP